MIREKIVWLPFLLLAPQTHAQWVPAGLDTVGTIFALQGWPNYLLAGAMGQIYRSPDNGNSWTAVQPSLASAFAQHGNYLYAGGGGVYRTPLPNGTSWSPANGGLPNAVIFSLTNSAGGLFAGNVDGQVYRTQNEGVLWTNASRGLPGTSSILSLAATLRGIFSGTRGDGVYRSTDSGASWNRADSGLTDPLITSMVANGGMGGRLFAGTYSGVFRTADEGASWTLGGPGGVLSLLASGRTLFAGTEGGVHLSPDSGSTWTDVSAGLPPLTEIYSLGTVGGFVFAGTRGSGVWRRAMSEMVPTSLYRSKKVSLRYQGSFPRGIVRGYLPNGRKPRSSLQEGRP